MSKLNNGKGGAILYEEVLERNFEIIENFLAKFHTVFESMHNSNIEQDSVDQTI